jgi:hypothetical protein
MKWISAMDQLPKDRQEILVVNKDQFFIAQFAIDRFYCKNGTIFGPSKDVKWAELTHPDKAQSVTAQTA